MSDSSIMIIASKKIDKDHLFEVLAKLKVKHDPADIKASVLALQKHFDKMIEKNPSDELLECDNCHGLSPESVSTKQCPFCADIDEGDEVAEPADSDDRMSEPDEEEPEVDEDVPEIVTTKKKTAETTKKATEKPSKPSAPTKVAAKVVKTEEKATEKLTKAPVKADSGKPAENAKKPAGKVEATKVGSKTTKTEEKATEKPTKGLVKSTPVVEAILDPKDQPTPKSKLDQKVRDVFLLKAEGAVMSWRLGSKLLEIFDEQLWKQRVDANGKPKYLGFKNFVEAELNMNKNTAYELMDVAKNCNEEQVRQFGTKKMYLLQKAPSNIREEIMKDIESGASKKDVEEKVIGARKKEGTARRETGRKKMPVGKAPTTPVSDKITVAMMVGRSKPIEFFTKASLKDEKPKFAKKIEEEPVGTLELTNRVKQTFYLRRNNSGGISLVVVTKRDEA